jgi:hypothetical protein
VAVPAGFITCKEVRVVFKHAALKADALIWLQVVILQSQTLLQCWEQF